MTRTVTSSKNPVNHLSGYTTSLRAFGACAVFAAAAVSVVACSGTKEAADSAKSAATSLGGQASSLASSASSAVNSAQGEPKTLQVPGVGEVVLEGPIAAVYEKNGGEGKLGLPAAQPEKVGEGSVVTLKNDAIYWSPEAGAHLIQGEILRVYKNEGGPAGALGFPTEDEAETAGGPKVAQGGWISEFEHGTITWLNQGNGVFKETVTKK